MSGADTPPSRRRRLLSVLLVVNGILLPVGCCPVFIFCNAFNPMQIGFITDFTVENRTGEDLLVTPIGAVGPAGTRYPLPMYASSTPAFPSSAYGRFPVANGRSIVLRYDWDDINFSELVVETGDGRLLQLVVNPEPTKNQYRIPARDRFVISDLGALEAAPADVRAGFHLAIQETPVLLAPSPWMAIVALLPVVTFLLLLDRWRRSGASRHATATPQPPIP